MLDENHLEGWSVARYLVVQHFEMPESDHGARKAGALGAGFPCHHLIEASMAFKDSVRKGS